MRLNEVTVRYDEVRVTRVRRVMRMGVVVPTTGLVMIKLRLS